MLLVTTEKLVIIKYVWYTSLSLWPSCHFYYNCYFKCDLYHCQIIRRVLASGWNWNIPKCLRRLLCPTAAEGETMRCFHFAHFHIVIHSSTFYHQLMWVPYVQSALRASLAPQTKHLTVKRAIRAQFCDRAVKFNLSDVSLSALKFDSF